MRCSLALTVLSAVALAAGSTINIHRRQSFPNCSLPCLVAPANSGCSAEDDGCLCRDQAFITASTQCIEQNCTGSDLTNAEAAAQGLCNAVGVTITSSPSSAPTSASSTSSGSGSSSSSESSSGSASASVTTTTAPAPSSTGTDSSDNSNSSTSAAIRTVPALTAIVAAALGAALAL